MPAATALRADRMVVGGELVWRRISHLGAATLLGLRLTRCAILEDDEPSWPETGRLLIVGFAYDAFGPGSTAGLERIGWVERQPRYAPRPYSQLARVFRERGQDNEAQQVAIAKQERRRLDGDLRPAQRAWAWVLETVIGYGYRPARSPWLALGVVLLGWLLFALAAGTGVVEAAGQRQASGFQSLVYSFDLFVPVIDLGQADAFTVVSGDGAEAVFRWYRWFHILIGWVLSTLAVIGFSGVVRRD